VLVIHAPPATEPVSIAEVKAHCRIDSSSQEPAPEAFTAAIASPAAPGNVDGGVHRYLATFVTASGETQAGGISAAVTIADKAVNGQVSLTGIPLGGALVTARKLYRTAAAGSTYLLLATITNNTATTYTDNIADSSLGAQAPSVNTTDDPILSILVASARVAAEQQLQRYLVTQTVDKYLDAFPSGDIELPPLQSVTSITYVDNNGDVQTLDEDLYEVDAQSAPARISRAYNASWPSTRKQNNAVVIRFVAGYGAASAVPACVKQWMLVQIKTLYDNRERLTVGRSGLVELLSTFIDGLLDSERVYGRVG
jgi:uncharacterized phiE125 gp8 family phage protein